MLREGDFTHETGLPDENAVWHSESLEVVAPVDGTIPRAEGTHLRVKPVGEYDWREAPVRETVAPVILSLGAAKLLAEGRLSPDFWTNIHLNSVPGSENGVNVWGRRPESAAAWARPVRIREHVEAGEEQTVEAPLKEQMRRYLPAWEELSERLNLFQDGISEVSPDSDDFARLSHEFATKPDPYKEEVLWANDKFVIVNVLVPHLNGLHLVVHPRDDYWSDKGAFRRPWQQRNKDDLEYMRGFAEAFTILLSAYKLIAETEGLSFFNPEIHFSGNWAKDLLTEDQGGKLDLEHAVSADPGVRKDEKREHMLGQGEEFQTSVHVHLYMTDNADRYVALPERPASEAPEQWTGIEPTDPDKISRVRTELQSKLAAYLSANLGQGDPHEQP